MTTQLVYLALGVVATIAFGWFISRLTITLSLAFANWGSKFHKTFRAPELEDSNAWLFALLINTIHIILIGVSSAAFALMSYNTLADNSVGLSLIVGQLAYISAIIFAMRVGGTFLGGIAFGPSLPMVLSSLKK